MCRRSRKAKNAFTADKSGIRSAPPNFPVVLKARRGGTGPARIVYQIFVGAFGGLDGVAAHLDHVAALGADAVYLTPDLRRAVAAQVRHQRLRSRRSRVRRRGGVRSAGRRLRARARSGSSSTASSTTSASSIAGAREHPDWFTGSDWRGFPSLRELDTANADGARAPAATWSRAGPRAAPPAGGSTAPTISACRSPASWRGRRATPAPSTASSAR